MTSIHPEEQDPLEDLLDEVSDIDFGLPLAAGVASQQESPLILKEWTAKDFSNIYVRFHPHLLRHAKRYLSNHSQAEEVVQDAFLYLMTSLPEVDSEVGALKLLKWKVRLLALDVISSNGRASYSPIGNGFDIESDTEESDFELVRADESAIVSLALAKLSPRQREALVASIYEEKSNLAVSQQLGINENATKQLLHRAKSAFRKALIGEAETQGLSVSQILSIAARKASQDAGRYVSVASASLLLLALSIGILPNLGQPSVTSIASVSDSDVSESTQGLIEPPVGEALSELPDEASVGVEPAEAAVVAEVEDGSVSTVFVDQNSNIGAALVANPTTPDEISAPPSVLALEANLLGSLSNIGTRNAGFGFPAGAQPELSERNVVIYSNSGLFANVDLVNASNGDATRLSSPTFQFETDRGLTATRFGDYAVTSSEGPQGSTLTLVANELFLVDSDGVDYGNQPSRGIVVTLVIQLDRLGQLTQASVFAQ